MCRMPGSVFIGGKGVYLSGQGVYMSDTREYICRMPGFEYIVRSACICKMLGCVYVGCQVVYL
jgi:hypothetical protein